MIRETMIPVYKIDTPDDLKELRPEPGTVAVTDQDVALFLTTRGEWVNAIGAVLTDALTFETAAYPLLVLLPDDTPEPGDTLTFSARHGHGIYMVHEDCADCAKQAGRLISGIAKGERVIETGRYYGSGVYHAARTDAYDTDDEKETK